MAGITIPGGLDMITRLARGHAAIMAGAAGTGDIGMGEIRRQPGIGAVAIDAIRRGS